jgi:hypothetical protein
MPRSTTGTAKASAKGLAASAKGQARAAQGGTASRAKKAKKTTSKRGARYAH